MKNCSLCTFTGVIGLWLKPVGLFACKCCFGFVFVRRALAGRVTEPTFETYVQSVQVFPAWKAHQVPLGNCGRKRFGGFSRSELEEWDLLREVNIVWNQSSQWIWSSETDLGQIAVKTLAAPRNNANPRLWRKCRERFPNISLTGAPSEENAQCRRRQKYWRRWATG